MVELTDEEAIAVRWALGNYLPELSYEVARTDRKRDQHPIAELVEVLARLRERLDASGVSDPPLGR